MATVGGDSAVLLAACTNPHSCIHIIGAVRLSVAFLSVGRSVGRSVSPALTVFGP